MKRLLQWLTAPRPIVLITFAQQLRDHGYPVSDEEFIGTFKGYNISLSSLRDGLPRWKRWLRFQR